MHSAALFVGSLTSVPTIGDRTDSVFCGRFINVFGVERAAVPFEKSAVLLVRRIAHSVEEQLEPRQAANILRWAAPFAGNEAGISDISIGQADLLHDNPMPPVVAHVIGVDYFAEFAVDEGAEFHILRCGEVVVRPLRVRRAVAAVAHFEMPEVIVLPTRGGLGTGAYFIFVSSHGGVILTPELKSAGGWVPFVQFVAAMALIWRPTCALAGAIILLLYGYAVDRYGIFHLTDYVFFPALAFYLISLVFPSWRLAAIREPMLTGALAFSLAWTAIEKFVYPRETQEMVFDAHARGFVFFGGVPLRGIYDNMKTAVTTVFVGKERVFNRRFLVMADHYMVEPTACSPAAGWEKGQVEHQVQTVRGRFFKPRLRFASLEELNGWLEAECLRWAATHPHPDHKEMTVAQALALERPALQPMLAPFDGFHETQHGPNVNGRPRVGDA